MYLEIHLIEDMDWDILVIQIKITIDSSYWIY